MKKQPDPPAKLLRVPPSAVPLEEVVLGALLLDKNAMFDFGDILKPETFYVAGHATIFQAMQRLYARSNPIDAMTVMEELRAMGELERIGSGDCKGLAYLASLTMKVASSANLEYHCRILQQFQVKRDLIALAMRIEAAAYDETVDALDEALPSAEMDVFRISQGVSRGVQYSMPKLILDAQQSIHDLINATTGIIGIPTGWAEVDKYTTGFVGGESVILAARTSMGKTTIACEWALGALAAGKKVSFFSMGDMSAVRLIRKLTLMLAGVKIEDIRASHFTPDDLKKITDAGELLAGMPLVIHDTRSIGGSEFSAVRSQMRKDVSGGADIIFVDYLQQIRHAPYTDATAVVSAVSDGLKEAATMLNIPIVQLCQINREAENRGGAKRPTMADAKQSGKIEENADYFFAVYRPDYYGIMEDAEGNSLVGVTELITLKARETGRVPYTFFRRRYRITGRLVVDGEPTLEEKIQYKATISAPVNGELVGDIPF